MGKDSKDLILVVGFENICRLCMHSTDAMSDILPTSGKRTLQQQIFYITGLVTRKSDGLPSKICHRCRHIVEQASELREVAERSQKILVKTVLNPSYCDANVVKEADPEPFDNEIFLQNLTDTNDSTESITEKKSHVQQHSEPNSNEERYSEPNSPEELDGEPNSPEELDSEPNSPGEQYNEINTVFLPDDVDHTTEITAEETEEELPRKKKSKKPLTCQLCNTQFASTEEVRPHVTQHYVDSEHLQIYLDIKSRPYLCTVCDEEQPNMARLMMHHRKHLGINPCRCSVPGCKYVGPNPFHLRRHRSVHDLRRRQCKLCQEVFYRRDLLTRHVAREHPSEDKTKDSAKQVVTEIEPYRLGSRWFTRDDGHFYVIYRQRNATSSLRCHREGCPARFNIKKAQAGPITEEHNHPPTPWVPSRNLMFQALKRRSTEESTPLRTIYKEEAARYPAAAPHLPFETAASSMRKWRSAARPKEKPWGRDAIEELSEPIERGATEELS